MDRARVEAVQTWESLFRAQVAVVRRLREHFKDAEVTLGEYDVLYNLTLFPGKRMRLHVLNENIVLTQPSLSRLVERMEAKRLVRREPDPQDGRGTVVVLTEQGLAVQRRVGRAHAGHIERYMAAGLDADDLAMLRTLCEKLRLAQQEVSD